MLPQERSEKATNGKRRKKGGWNARKARGRERTYSGEFVHGEALAFVVVVNPMVSLISRPTAIRFAALSSVFSVGRARDVLSPFDFILPQLSPFRIRDGDGGANGADRNSGGLSEEKQSREDFSVSSPETERVVRKMIYLCFLEPRLGLE